MRSKEGSGATSKDMPSFCAILLNTSSAGSCSGQKELVGPCISRLMGGLHQFSDLIYFRQFTWRQNASKEVGAGDIH
jgi:hypothetical protein